MKRINPLLWCVLITICCACSRKSIPALERRGIVVKKRHHELNAGGTAGKIDIQYLGCGGLLIRHAGQVIMIDPFFSNQRIFKLVKSSLAGGKIRSKPSSINFGRQRILDSLKVTDEILRKETKAIFAAHGHYDHLMDIPYVFHEWFDAKPDVYVNSSSYNAVYNAIKLPEKLHDAEAIMSVGDIRGSSVDFNAEDGSVMKVYPIKADHNPHALNIKFFSGAVMCPLPHFEGHRSKTKANDWLEGRTLSFLVDIERNGSIVYRIFIQSSSTHYPDGMPPASLLAKRPVDLAIPGVASYHFSEATYPCNYLRALNAKHVMYIHWEDFFRNYKRKPKSVLATDIPRFFKCVASQCDVSGYILPAPGVVTTIQY